MSELKVGLLAIAAMIATAYMSLKVTSNQSGFGDYITYRTIIKDASGIFPKTPIKVAGINAGRIQSIELQENNALITFEVLSRVKITKGSILGIRSVGFLGDKYLEIKIGSSETRLAEGSLITSKEGGGMERLMQDAGEMMTEVKGLIKELKNSIAPEGQESPIKEMLVNLKDVSIHAKKLTKDLSEIVGENKEKLNSLIASFESFSSSLDYEFNQENPDASLAEIKQILGSTKQLTADLQALVSDIKQGKGTLGKVLVEEEIADEVKETLAGVKKIVSRVDALRTELEVFAGASTSGTSVTDAGIRIYPSPERFYSLGLVTSELGPKSEKITTTVVDGVESTEVRTEQQKDSYRFNVQLGRKVQNWTFRGGLFETTGGLGVDYDIYNWGSRFSFEVFDYDEDDGPNLRLIYSLRVWNVLYAKMAYDDMIRDTQNAVFSFGLRFNDEDLKGLLGFFF